MPDTTNKCTVNSPLYRIIYHPFIAVSIGIQSTALCPLIGCFLGQWQSATESGGCHRPHCSALVLRFVGVNCLYVVLFITEHISPYVLSEVIPHTWRILTALCPTYYYYYCDRTKGKKEENDCTAAQVNS